MQAVWFRNPGSCFDVIGDGVNQDVALDLPAFTCIDGLECPGSYLAWPLVFLDEGECELTIGTMLWGIQVALRVELFLYRRYPLVSL